MTAYNCVLAVVVILGVFFFLHNAAKEKRRRGEARILFLKARSFQSKNCFEEAYEILHFIRWNLVDKPWFENFIDTDTVVTREVFMEINNFLLGKVRPNEK